MPGGESAVAGEHVTWTIPNARLDSSKIPILIATLLAVFGMTVLIFHGLLMGVLAAALLLGVTLSPTIPLTYVLDSSGARVNIGSFVWLEMPWSAVLCIYSVHGGLKLSAFENPAVARLESHRGIRLRVPKELAPAVESQIERGRCAQC